MAHPVTNADQLNMNHARAEKNCETALQPSHIFLPKTRRYSYDQYSNAADAHTLALTDS
jgi:hypothetical protein